MENTNVEKKAKAAKPSAFAAIRVRKETRKRVLAELAKANKKDFGKRVHADEYLTLALSLVTQLHIKQLQEGSLSNTDRFEMAYREYVSKNGPISKDAYLGKRLNGEILVSDRNSETQQKSP